MPSTYRSELSAERPLRERTTRALFALWLSWFCAVCQAQPIADGVTLQIVANGLASPTALAIRPGGSRSGPDLFLADSADGRIFGLSTKESKPTLVEAVVDLPMGQLEGPCCLVFRTRNHLLVGLNGADGKPASVRDYDLDDDRLPMPGDEHKVLLTYSQDEGPFHLAAMARDNSKLIAATAEHHWLLEGKLSGGPPQKLLPFVDTLEATKIGVPRAITTSEKNYLVVGQAGQRDAEGDSLLVFYHPVDKTAGPLLQLSTGLDDIVSLSYSPTTGNLYAANQSDLAADREGVYRLDAAQDATTGEQQCEAVLIVQISRPTALAFSRNGHLYVASKGEATADDNTSEESGKLLKLTGGL